MTHAADFSRRFYEGDGGWNDGRLGQAYDLISAVLKDRGENAFRHPLTAQIEEMDQEQVPA
jgi:hypothetical protein